jgi:hypothetical protein
MKKKLTETERIAQIKSDLARREAKLAEREAREASKEVREFERIRTVVVRCAATWGGDSTLFHTRNEIDKALTKARAAALNTKAGA